VTAVSEGFLVSPDALRRLARQVDDVRAALAELRPDAELRAASQAVPGGRLAGAAETAAASWTAALARAAADLETMARALASSAGGYETTDQRAAARLGRLRW
jgi:hypothetical protein